MDDTAEMLIEMLDACGRRLHVLLAKLTMNHDAADELMQDLFVRLLKSKMLAEAPNPEAYLFRSAINLAFDWRKQSSRDPEFTILDHEIATEDMPPVDQLVQNETTKQVLSAMDLLSDTDRELICLRFIQGESHEWIASRFNSTPHSIRSRCSKAVTRLRKLVATPETQLKRKES